MSASAPTVSVCIRAFARPEGLRAAIESVLAQSFQDFEVVVSDDSGDMAAIVADFADPRVRYHRNPRPAGHVANIVTAFGLARGRLLALLDDDDVWMPGCLAAAVAAFERDAELGIVFTDYYLAAGRWRVRRRPALPAGRQANFLRRILEDCPIAPSAAVMRRAVWEQGEQEYPLEAGAVGDATMWIRAALAGWPFHYVDEPLATYRLHGAQLSWKPGIQARSIHLFDRFRFEDPDCERLRLSRLAEARLAEAGAHLWQRRFRAARREIALARRAAPGALGVRGWLALTGLRPRLVRVAATSPPLLVAALRGWRAVRPPVDPGPHNLERLLAGVEGWLGLREARTLHQAAFRHCRASCDLAAVEIGSWKGRSTVAIASGLKRAGTGVLHAIDPHEGSRTHALAAEESTYEALRENVRRAGVERYVKPLRGLSSDVSTSFDVRSVGLLFVDGSHRYEDVVSDIEGWLPRLCDGATVAFHDAARYPDVSRALRDRVLCEGSGFDRPRFVQNTLFVTRSVHDRPLGLSRLSRRRGRFVLGLRRRYAGLTPALAPLRRIAPGWAARRARRAGAAA